MTVYSYAPTYPHARERWLRHATNVAYSMELMAPGKFMLDLPANDPLTADVIGPGALVGITSSSGLPDFCGWVDRIEESHGGAYVTVSGREWMGLLGERATAQEQTYRGGSSGGIATDLVRAAAARNPTSIQIMPVRTSTAVSSPFTVRSDSVLDALGDLADLTGNEFEVRYQAGVTAQAQLFWTEQVGSDLSATVHLAGRMIASADYLIDAIGDAAIVRVVGSTGPFGDRPSAAAVDGAAALQDIATVRVGTPAGKTPQRRGIGTSRETVIRDASLPDGLSVQRKSLELLRSITSGAETLSVVVSRLADWSKLRPGNIVTVRLPRLRFGDHVVRRFRILGLQPREERGSMELLGKVLTDA